MATSAPSTTNQPLPTETVVLSNLDGERGVILNGFACQNGEWTQYEVITQYGIERWNRSDFLLMAECQIDE